MSGLPFWRGIARILSHESLRQEVRSFGRWSLVAPFVMAILFACGQVALVRPTGMAAADTGSLIQADYQAWPSQVFAPLVEEIIPEIQRENNLLPAQVVVPGDYYPGDSGAPPAAIPVALLETPPPAHDPVQSNSPSPATATPRSPPAQGSPASTPTPTVLPMPYPAPNRLPTSTLRPAATATRIPSQTPVPSPTRTRLPSATLTRTPTRTPTQFYPVQTSTATMTPSLTSSVTPSPSATQATATLTRTPTQTVPPSSTATATSTFTATPTLTSTATPTQTSLPSMTPTSTLLPPTPWMPPNTNTPTFTPSPTDTPSPTPTTTSTPTPMPTSTDTPTPTALPLPPNIDIGDPDGEINDIQCGTGELVDLGAQVWIDTLILYEFYNPGGCNGGICLDWIYIDLSDSADGPWTQYFYWGDANGGNNGNVEAYHFPGGVEQDNENIPPAELLNNSGILIGVGGTYRYVRLTAPNPCGDPAQVDSIDYWP